MLLFPFFSPVWFKVKLHVRDQKQQLDKKKLVAFWLEHYAKRDHGKPLTVVFDMAETGISHIVSMLIGFFFFPACFLNYLICCRMPALAGQLDLMIS